MAIAELTEGIEILCKNDNDIERLIEPRKNEIISLLTRYINEIELFNSAYGLVGVCGTKELVIRHILDSLAPLGIISRLLKGKDKPKIADAGSGAGLPGIPLAIAMPDCEWTLIERMGRRAGFLNNTKAVLELNITVEEGELENTKRGRFSLITFRAFKPLQPKLLKTLFNACANTGIVAAYKGQLKKTEQETGFLDSYKLENHSLTREIIPYKVPFLEEERHLLVVRGKDEIITSKGLVVRKS